MTLSVQSFETTGAWCSDTKARTPKAIAEMLKKASKALDEANIPKKGRWLVMPSGMAMKMQVKWWVRKGRKMVEADGKFSSPVYILQDDYNELVDKYQEQVYGHADAVRELEAMRREAEFWKRKYERQREKRLDEQMERMHEAAERQKEEESQ